MAVTLPAHSYLGDLQNLEGRTPLLDIGTTYQLPMLPIDDGVVCPGDLFPLRVTDPRLSQIVRAALQAPPPISRLIALIMPSASGPLFGNAPLNFSTIACTVEIIKQSIDGTSLLTQARQRVEIDFGNSPQPLDFQRISMRVIPDTLPRPLPFSPNSNQGAWPNFVYQQVDATALAKTAKILFTERFTSHSTGERSGNQDEQQEFTIFRGDPIQISYNLIGNAPFNRRQRRLLLQIETVVERLTKQIEFLKDMECIYCDHCFHRIAQLNELIQVNDEGIGGHYVNSHGALHDMLTVKNASVRIVSEPETDNSWFPGYAWQIAYCEGCREHLGWYFTAVDGGHNNTRLNRQEVSGEEATGVGDDGGGVLRGQQQQEECGALTRSFYGLRSAALENKAPSEMRRVLNAFALTVGMVNESDEEESEDDEEEEGEEGSEWETASDDSRED